MSDKKGEFEQERMPRRVSKLPISMNFDEIVEMDFGGDGGKGSFLHLQDTSPMYSIIVFICNKKRKRKSLTKCRVRF